MRDMDQATAWRRSGGQLHTWCGVCQRWRPWAALERDDVTEFPDGERLDWRACDVCSMPLVRVVAPCWASADSRAAYLAPLCATDAAGVC